MATRRQAFRDVAITVPGRYANQVASALKRHALHLEEVANDEPDGRDYLLNASHYLRVAAEDIETLSVPAKSR